jgi:septal ring factor EnvC (AmiA/AmiB activator)
MGSIMPVVTAIGGWFAGKKKRNNDFLQDLQESVNMLTGENKKLLKELIEVRNELIESRNENSVLLNNQSVMQSEITLLRKENKELKNEIEQLKENLSNVKTITRKG